MWKFQDLAEQRPQAYQHDREEFFLGEDFGAA
jgi:hypothetical protein